MNAQAMAVGVDDRGGVRLVGRYAISAPIGSGGMATVHLGRLLGTAGFSRVVAIKRLHPQYAQSPEFVRAFLDEAWLAARVRHPNVLPTIDVIAEQDELLIVMEYVTGESLFRLLKSPRGDWRRVPPAVAVAIVAGALHGLHAAHEAVSESGAPLDLVHRDVSPHNIIVGTDGVARVLDFGIAKAVGRFQSTPGGELKGKLAYMAPEHLLEGKIDRRADIYAASVVLWEALTGRPLFQRDDRGSTLAAVLAKAIPAPGTIVEGLPLALEALVMRGLSRKPSERFATAREFAVALEEQVDVATADQVGRWVGETARDTLAERAALVTALETAPEPLAAEAPVAVVAPPPLAERDVTFVGQGRLRWAAVVGAAMVGTVAAWQLLKPRPIVPAPVVAEPDRRPRVQPLWPDPPAPAVVQPAPAAERETTAAERPAVAPSPRVEPRAESLATTAPARARADAPERKRPTVRRAAKVRTPKKEVRADRRVTAKAKPATKVEANVNAEPPRPRVPAAPQTTCDPPYTVDPNGIQRLKRECL